MAKTIDDFKSIIGSRGGLARSNKFLFTFAPPPAVKRSLGLNLEELSLLCKSVAIPGRSITTFEKQDYRESYKVPYIQEFEDFSATFLLTNDYMARGVFSNWLNAIADPNSGTLSYRADYIADASISQLGPKDQEIYRINIKDMYPISIPEISFNSSNSADPIEMTITFTYKYMTEEPIFNRPRLTF